MRSVAEQSVDELGGPHSLLVRMRVEHGQMDELIDQLTAASGDAQDELLTQLWRLVYPHAYAEETLVWPAIRAVATDGEQVTLHVEQGHQKLSELTAALEQTRRGDPRRDELLEEICAELRLDIREEEDMLLPRLQQGTSVQQLRRLGRTWQLIRQTAPTRPHVALSRRPPGNALAAVPLSVLDRARDRLDRRARRSGRGATLAVATSRGLSRVAGALEQLPSFQRGEHGLTRPGRWEVHRDRVAARNQERRASD